MNNDALIKSFFKESFLQQQPADFLSAATAQYPYFTLAHFLRLKSMDTKDLHYPSNFSHTAILFNNPHWLNFQLNTNGTFGQKPESIQAQNQSLIGSDKTEDLDGSVSDRPLAGVSSLADMAASLKSDSPEHSNLEESLLFEPLHTTDYFASQGIKLSEEVKPTDKLGNQLKSFTQWLKTMKKIHPAELEKMPISNESDIQQLAEKSNYNEPVATEAMAEVLIQQGMIQKAIELMEKLSLQNPSKSAYFASRMENLKKQ